VRVTVIISFNVELGIKLWFGGIIRDQTQCQENSFRFIEILLLQEVEAYKNIVIVVFNVVVVFNIIILAVIVFNVVILVLLFLLLLSFSSSLMLLLLSLILLLLLLLLLSFIVIECTLNRSTYEMIIISDNPQSR